MDLTRPPLLVFDGDCGICTRLAQWVERRRPPASDFSVVPWQRLDLGAVGLTQADVDAAAWWVGADGAPRRGHRAAAAALRAIGGWWSIIGYALGVPPVSWSAAGVYRIVASSRHRLSRFGITPACADEGGGPSSGDATVRSAAIEGPGRTTVSVELAVGRRRRSRRC